MPTRPKIVVLDGYAANPGDLSWAPLEAAGDVTVHPRTPKEQVVDRCEGAAAVLVNKVAIGDDAMAKLPDLRYVGVLATGFNIVDVSAARRRGIVVTNVPAYSSESTAQHAFALLLELTNHVGSLSRESPATWPKRDDFAYWETPLVELAGLTCGVVGFGGIGQAFARRARAFGMNVVAHTRTPEKHTKEAAKLGVKLVDLRTLLASSDVVSLHCPLTPETTSLINSTTLGQMKRGALLINAARGPIVDEAAVAAALQDGQLGGAGIDVLSEEPPRKGSPLLTAPNCVVTPHVAWATTAARRRLIEAAAANVKAFFAGSPTNVVN